MLNFAELVKSRHSAINFIEGVPILDKDIRDIFELVRLAPSVHNLQPTEFLVVRDQSMKDLIYSLSNKQYKIKTSSAVIIVMRSSKAFEQESIESIYSPMKMLGMISSSEYEQAINIATTFASTVDLEAEGIRNASIIQSFLLLAAKHHGWDTCPMHVHNEAKIKKMFKIPEHLEPVALVAIGKSVDKKRPRGFRKPVSQFVHLDTIT